MKLRWLLWDYVDAALPLTLRQRMRLARRPIWISNLPSGTLRGRIWFAMSLAVPGMVSTAVISLSDVGRSLSSAGFVLWFVLLMIVFWVWSSIAFGLFCGRELRYRVRLEGYEVCMNCGYWLRGLSDGISRCPECGEARESMPIDDA